jgi:O-antigen ligase
LRPIPSKSRPAAAESTIGAGREVLFALAAGAFFGLALLKFGNPIILDFMVPTPKGLDEWRIQSWPLKYGYAIFSLVLVFGIVNGEWKGRKMPMLYWIPLLWLAWQGVATFDSIDRPLSVLTLRHFTVCVFLFYLGWHNPMKNGSIFLFFCLFLVSFIVILRVGFDQHFGGLAETERQFFLYTYPKLRNPPLDLVKKMKTARIFSTLFYPNTLAAVIIFLLPMLIGLLGRLRNSLRFSIRIGLGMALIPPACACLFWSGSKAGWLIFLALGVIATLHSNLAARIKHLLVVVVCLGGLMGFFIRYKSFFEGGATSVSARFYYWEAAWKIGCRHPVLGTGPGTFGQAYNLIRPPGAEPSKMAHNDYLQQWSDSGIVGFSMYLAMIVGCLAVLYRKRAKLVRNEDFWIWLGLLGLALHSLVEFHLYIPALAWPMFFLLGRQSSLACEQAVGRILPVPLSGSSSPKICSISVKAAPESSVLVIICAKQSGVISNLTRAGRQV